VVDVVSVRVLCLELFFCECGCFVWRVVAVQWCRRFGGMGALMCPLWSVVFGVCRQFFCLVVAFSDFLVGTVACGCGGGRASGVIWAGCRGAIVGGLGVVGGLFGCC